MLIALAGASAGAVLAAGGVRTLSIALSRLALPVPGEVELNLRVLGATLAVLVVTGLLFGSAPALEAARHDTQSALRAEGPTTTVPFARLRLHRVFVALEVALAAVLVAGSGPLVHRFLKLQTVAPGFWQRERAHLPRHAARGALPRSGHRHLPFAS